MVWDVITEGLCQSPSVAGARVRGIHSTYCGYSSYSCDARGYTFWGAHVRLVNRKRLANLTLQYDEGRVKIVGSYGLNI